MPSDKETKLKRMINTRRKKCKRHNIRDKKEAEHKSQYRGNFEDLADDWEQTT